MQRFPCSMSILWHGQKGEMTIVESPDKKVRRKWEEKGAREEENYEDSEISLWQIDKYKI